MAQIRMTDNELDALQNYFKVDREELLIYLNEKDVKE
jgi:hypothetical protein